RVSVPALRRSQNALQISKPIEQLLSSASGKDPKQTAYLIAMAEIRDLQGDYSRVKELYRKVLELDGNSLVALNNLAWFLAVEQNAANEGLEVIDRAIRLAGPVGELLDTRAVIELRMGLPIQAIKDLQEAIADASIPNRLFHLAQANFLANNKS